MSGILPDRPFGLSQERIDRFRKRESLGNHAFLGSGTTAAVATGAEAATEGLPVTASYNSPQFGSPGFDKPTPSMGFDTGTATGTGLPASVAFKPAISAGSAGGGWVPCSRHFASSQARYTSK